MLLTLILAIALNGMDHSGGDAAGNGMAKGFAFIIAMGAGLAMLAAAGLFALVRRLWFRIALLVLVYALALLLFVGVVA